MSLEPVPRVRGLADSRVERVVYGVEHVPHVVSALTHSCVNLASETFGSRALLLRSGYVLLRVPGPGLRDGDGVVDVLDARVVTCAGGTVAVLLDTVVKALCMVLVLGVDLQSVLGRAVHPADDNITYTDDR